MKRLVWVSLALLTSLAGGAAAVWAMPDEAAGVSTGDAEQAFDRELALASDHGLTVVDRGETLDATLARSTPVAANACVALVVAASGPGAISATSLRLGTASAATPSPHLVAHHALCTREPAVASALVSTSTDRARYGPTTLRWALLTGPLPPDLESYPRLSMDDALASALAADGVRARVAALLGPSPRALRDTTEVRRDAAWLVPVSRATDAARRATTGSLRRLPRALRAPGDPPDPFAREDEREVDPFLHVAAGRLRLLLVIDAGAVVGSCMRVSFADLGDPTAPIAITRLALPGLEEEAVPAPDPAIAIDEICADDGLLLYGVPFEGADSVEIAIVASGEIVPPSRPSTFEPTPLVLPVVRDLRSRCDAGETGACLELARFASEGAVGAGDVESILGPRCQAEGQASCALLAAALRDAGAAPARIDALERRACATGDLPSCLRRAAAFRERGEMAQSLALYQFACERGDGAACTSAALFSEWSLAERQPTPLPEALP